MGGSDGHPELVNWVWLSRLAVLFSKPQTPQTVPPSSRSSHTSLPHFWQEVEATACLAAMPCPTLPLLTDGPGGRTLRARAAFGTAAPPAR